ncbi:MAG: hypothetical protein ACR2IS_02300 [Nitrososphaeraceae archaeon]
MDNAIKPILKRQLLIMGSGIGICFLVAYFFGLLMGFVANTLFFIGVMFYIRRRDSSMRRSSLFNYRRAANSGKFTASEMTKLKYICLSCGSEVKDAQCSECGSKIRKPIF